MKSLELKILELLKLMTNTTISYTAVSEYGINVRLMVTADFKKFTRLGNIFHFDNKDVVLFPKKIGVLLCLSSTEHQ